MERKMVKKNSCRLIFLSFFIAIISIVQLGCAQQNTGQSGVEQIGVQYDVWPGVTAAAKADTEKGVNETIDFFKLMYGVNLNRHVKVVLVADNSSYKTALMQETGATEIEAERRAKVSVAWSSGHTIVRNTAQANDQLNNIFKISHEMVHQYQDQETGGAAMRLEWLAEGMADVIAAHVLDRVQLMPMMEYKRMAQATIGVIKNPPSISGLGSSVGWNQALESYGSAVTYRSADMGVLLLVEKNGLPSLMEFLRDLQKNGVLADSFQKSFGVDIKTFEQQYDEYLHSLVRKAS